MRIAAVTMVGQFPEGIAPHVRNLLWVLSPEDHIYVVTLPGIIESQKLASGKRVTYIPFDCQKEGWINFWGNLNRFVKAYSIKPEWFLFMETDIWFHRKPKFSLSDPKKITSFLPTWSEYHNIMLDGNLFHYRVWEGAQLISGGLVRDAIKFGVNFSFVKETFLDKNRKKYEKEFGGKLTLSNFDIPDTMDEFGLYCALVGRTSITPDVCAVHLRGPESIHRRFPEFHKGKKSLLPEVQKAVPYIDIYEVIAAYYITGAWKSVSDLDWGGRKALKNDLKELLAHCKEWMTTHEWERTKQIHEEIRNR